MIHNIEIKRGGALEAYASNKLTHKGTNKLTQNFYK